MSSRKDTFDDDILRIQTDLTKCRNPTSLLVHIMGQMKAGKFVGHMAKPDEEIIHLSKKFKLDEEAKKKLCEYIRFHPPERRQQYYTELELHLDASKFPTKAVMMFLRKIRYNESLGPVKGKGKGKDKGKDDDR